MTYLPLCRIAKCKARLVLLVKFQRLYVKLSGSMRFEPAPRSSSANRWSNVNSTWHMLAKRCILVVHNLIYYATVKA